MESLSRLGQRISENINESTRNLTFAGSARDLFDGGDDGGRKHVVRLLESSHEREQVEGMKRLIALISKAHPVGSFFPHVLKLVSSPSLELRKLVYIYILRHAEGAPDLALLCINTFQKDLRDPSPLIRAMAVRVLSGMRVPSVGGVVELAVKQAAADPNPHVRKAAALALPKLHAMDPSHPADGEVVPVLRTLLADPSPILLGAALHAFDAVCPLRLELLHPHFRRFCRVLVECDEWAQVGMLDVLTRYARTMLVPPPPPAATADDGGVAAADPDLVLLLSASAALLTSPSPAVVLAAARTHHALSPLAPGAVPHLAPPLLKLLHHADAGVRLAVLRSVAALAGERPDVFDDDDEEEEEEEEGAGAGGKGEERWRAFLLAGGERKAEATAKIAVLREIVNAGNAHTIVDELIFYERNPSEAISAAAVAALGECARRRPEVRDVVTSALLKMLKNGRDSTTTAAILVLKALIIAQPPSSTPSQSTGALVARLASRFERITSAAGRACVVGLVGTYPGVEDGRVGLEVLRLGAKNFAHEQPEVKLALLTLAAKLFALPSLASPSSPLLPLAKYLFLLARYDAAYDVRDRARFLRALVRGLLDVDVDASAAAGDDGEGEEQETGGVVLRREQIDLVLNGGQRVSAPPIGESSKGALPAAEFGTFSLLIQPHFQPNYTPLPNWRQEGTLSTLRDPPPSVEQSSRSSGASAGALKGFGSDSRQAHGGGEGPSSGTGTPISAGAARKGFVDLDKFYEDTSSEESEDDTDESTEEDEDDNEEDASSASEEEADGSEEDDGSKEGSDEEDVLVPRRPSPPASDSPW